MAIYTASPFHSQDVVINNSIAEVELYENCHTVIVTFKATGGAATFINVRQVVENATPPLTFFGAFRVRIITQAIFEIGPASQRPGSGKIQLHTAVAGNSTINITQVIGNEA
jgi:hypothetical protein